MKASSKRIATFGMLAAALAALAALAVLAALPRYFRSPAPPPTAAPPSASAAPSTPLASPGEARVAVAGEVRVAVYDDGRPAANRWVVFHDAAGAVTSVAKTNRDGKAAGQTSGRADGMVTVADATSMRKLVTVVGVEGGDELVVGEDEDEEGAAVTACTARVRLPGLFPAATRFTVSLGVGTTEVGDLAKPLALPVLGRFLIGGKFRVLAEAYSASGEPVAYAHAWVDGCAVDAAPSTVDVRLPPWSTDYRPVDLEVSGAPHDGGALTASLSIVAESELGDRFDRGRRTAPVGAPALLHFAAPRPLGTTAILKLVVAYPDPLESSVLLERRPAMPSKVALDLRAQLLPRVSSLALEPSVDARPTLRWTVTPDALTSDASESASALPDAVVARVSWPATRDNEWTIVAPPSARQVRLPALPDELAAFRPREGPITAGVALVEASAYSGFAEVRRKGLVPLGEVAAGTDRSYVRYSRRGALDF